MRGRVRLSRVRDKGNDRDGEKEGRGGDGEDRGEGGEDRGGEKEERGGNPPTGLDLILEFIHPIPHSIRNFIRRSYRAIDPILFN